MCHSLPGVPHGKNILIVSVSWYRIYCRYSVCFQTHTVFLVSKSSPQHSPCHFSIICIPINFPFLWQSHNFSLTGDHRQNALTVQFCLQAKGHLFFKNLHELLKILLPRVIKSFLFFGHYLKLYDPNRCFFPTPKLHALDSYWVNHIEHSCIRNICQYHYLVWHGFTLLLVLVTL